MVAASLFELAAVASRITWHPRPDVDGRESRQAQFRWPVLKTLLQAVQVAESRDKTWRRPTARRFRNRQKPAVIPARRRIVSRRQSPRAESWWTTSKNSTARWEPPAADAFKSSPDFSRHQSSWSSLTSSRTYVRLAVMYGCTRPPTSSVSLIQRT